MTRHGRLLLAGLLAACSPAVSGQAPARPTALELAGTSWHLVQFQGGDGTVLAPDDGSKYEITFGRDNTLTVRLDCNRGRGGWATSGPGRIELGALAVTRALCPPGSLHDQILRQWGSIRSYVVKNDHLFLSLMADGGIYEFRPAAPATAGLQSPVTFRGPGVWACVGKTTGTSTLRVTFYNTQPALVLLEWNGDMRPAFQTKAASGAKYEGDGVLFWEARGEATLNWMGVESTCKR